jgi:transcriptional regulator with XRE-family HTH domain
MSDERVEVVPPGLWDLRFVREALDRRDIGELLDLVCGHSRISQHALGDIINVRQSRISDYIRHTYEPTLDTIAKIADRLGMPAQARQRLGLSRANGPSTARVRLSQILALAEQIGETGDTSCLGTWRETASAGVPDDIFAEFATISIQEPTELRAVERISTRTRGFFLAATKLPARLVIEALTAHAHEVKLLLDAIPDPVLRQELASVGGESSYLVACCNVDLGDLAGARGKLKVAGDVARQVKDTALSAIAVDGYSHLEAFKGNHRAALALVEQGTQASAMSGSLGTMAYMKLREAEEYNALGNPRAAAKVWEEAESFFAATDVQTDRNWIRLWLMPNGFDSVRTIIYSATGRRDEAVTVALALVDKLNGALGKSDAVALVNVTHTLAKAGNHSEAAEAGQQALRAIREAEATGCMPRLHELAESVRVSGRPAAAWRTFCDDLRATQRQFDGIHPRPQPDINV